MKTDFIGEIEKRLPEMSKRHKKIAEYLMKNGAKAQHMTACGLAEAAGVSESTVVRFAAAMGFDGYQEMRSSLSESVLSRMTTVDRIRDSGSLIHDNDVIGSFLRKDAEKILSTLYKLDRNDFEKCADMLINANRVYILGMRASSMLAQFMNYYLRVILENVTLVTPSSGSEVFEHIINLKPGDILVTISYPRYSSSAIRAAEFAKTTGAGVVVITDRKSAPVAEFGDVVLTAKSDTTSFVDSLVAPMSLINAIVAYIGMKLPDKTNENFNKLEEIWNDYKVYSE